MTTSKPADFTEHRIDGETLFEGSLLTLNRDRIRLHDGSEGTREYVAHIGAVAIIPVLPNGHILMERQHRYPLHRDLLEIPAGKMEPAELPLETARRELLEETGYRAGKWTHLTTMHPLAAYSTERMELYLAEDLEFEGAQLDDGEFLEVFELSLEDGLQMIQKGVISDMKTIIAFLWAEKLLFKGI